MQPQTIILGVAFIVLGIVAATAVSCPQPTIPFSKSRVLATFLNHNY